MPVSWLPGCRRSLPAVAQSFRESWVRGTDPVFWLAVVQSYRFDDWGILEPQEWDWLSDLGSKSDPAIDRELLWLLRLFWSHNSKLATDLLKAIASRADDSRLHEIAVVLSSKNRGDSGEWETEFEDPQDFREIMTNFLRMKSLDYYVEESLDRLGSLSPMYVIDFLEERVAIAEAGKGGPGYDPIPYDLSQAMESTKSSPTYADVLRRVRDWTLRADTWFEWVAPRLVKAFSANLGPPLDNLLMEWITSGDSTEMAAAIKILRSFNAGSSFYALCREVVSRTLLHPEPYRSGVT